MKNTNILSQENKLLEIITADYVLADERKIIALFAIKHNPQKSQSRISALYISELKKLYGVKNISYQDLRRKLIHLQQNLFYVGDEHGGVRCVSLFEELHFTKDRNGTEIIEIQCTRKAEEIIFTRENIEFVENLFFAQLVTEIT